ncbi:hypothetical protein LEP1GSC025_0536 [Leptospira interrogans str. 2002000621]|nr:hypothetical protein LEP1GSC025_0536 [Leptospira interrogans str. 2002000621]
MNEEKTNRKTEKKRNALTKKTSPQKKGGSFFFHSLEIFWELNRTHTFKYINILLFFCFCLLQLRVEFCQEKRKVQ